MSINVRISELIETLEGGSQKNFSRKTGIAASSINGIVGSRQSDPSSKLLNSVLLTYKNVNANWLLTGDGEMLKSDESNSNAEMEIFSNLKNHNYSETECRECKLKDKIIDSMEQQILTQSKLISYLEGNPCHNDYDQKRKVAS